MRGGSGGGDGGLRGEGGHVDVVQVPVAEALYDQFGRRDQVRMGVLGAGDTGELAIDLREAYPRAVALGAYNGADLPIHHDLRATEGVVLVVALVAELDVLRREDVAGLVCAVPAGGSQARILSGPVLGDGAATDGAHTVGHGDALQLLLHDHALSLRLTTIEQHYIIAYFLNLVNNRLKYNKKQPLGLSGE